MGDVVISLKGRALERDVEGVVRTVWRIGVADPSDSAAQVVDLDAPAVPGFGLYLVRSGLELSAYLPGPWIRLPESLSYLGPGDVIALLSGGNALRVLWRTSASINAVLLTEQCDNYCLMCSQPPRSIDDRWLLDQAVELVNVLDESVESILFTGGEPTIFGDDFLDLLRLCADRLPTAEVHILSNGRRFSDAEFAREYVDAAGPRVMVGIPLYGPEPSLHDYVVQAQGAFNETVRGVLNLAEQGARVELRVVVQKHLVPALEEIADFIVRNLPFVDQVALMGLEMTGFARSNVDDVWVDPYDYRSELARAALRLQSARIPTMIYNHQLCVLDRRVWHLAVPSISDWKNRYEPVCQGCEVRERCGGFFSTGMRHVSAHLSPVVEDEGPNRASVPVPSGGKETPVAIGRRS